MSTRTNPDPTFRSGAIGCPADSIGADLGLAGMNDEAAEESGISAAEHCPALTPREQGIAEQLFKQVFPDLVRKEHQNQLEKATKTTVAAIRAGLIALRSERSCACVESALKSLQSVDKAFEELRSTAAKVLSESRPAAHGPDSC